MKKLIYILIILININSCKAQKNTKMEQKIIMPKITDEFETLNEKDEKKEGIIIIENQSYGFIRREYLYDSYFVLNKKFSINKKILEKSISFVNGYPIGNIYKFDSQNEKIIEVINTDKGYDFSWKNVIAFCEEKKIPLTKGFKEFAGFQTRILKREENGKKVWVISYLLPVGDKIKEITLDGKTGEEIKQRTFDLIGG